MNHRRDLKRKKAEERFKERETRTPQQQLDRLDEMLGKGQGATKERASLAKLIGKTEKSKKSKKA